MVKEWESVIGLEVHLQLKTGTKVWCGCSADYDNDDSNTHTCPICLGHPGALPKLNKKVVEYAHSKDVTVEAELGVLAGIEDDVKAADHIYTNPDEVEDFVSKTGVDSLAIAIGTSHGAHKFKPGDDPKLRLDILQEIERRIPGFPIVLHGSSAVPGQYVEMIKQYGGTIKDAIGIPDSELRKATQSAVAKINVDTDGRLAFTAAVRRALAEKTGEFDLRKYLGPAKEEMKAYYKTKIVDVFGSEGAYKKATNVVK